MDRLLYKLLIYNLYKIDCKDSLKVLLDDLNIKSLPNSHSFLIFVLQRINEVNYIRDAQHLYRIIKNLEVALKFHNGLELLKYYKIDHLLKEILKDEHYEERMKYIW